ncbi:MAG: hypothetical protein KBE23_19695 [Chloroflexi bacterium]|nr:hypothetical protein [Chloroflexota bacterium]
MTEPNPEPPDPNWQSQDKDTQSKKDKVLVEGVCCLGWTGRFCVCNVLRPLSPAATLFSG